MVGGLCRLSWVRGCRYTSESSLHRMARAKQLPTPTTPADLLTVLGDQFDRKEPIFHDYAALNAGDASGMMTIMTMLFDVANGSATMYHGNPQHQEVHFQWAV
eukprot:m.173861 g.173861  ORF g.173861 m.173861 type:complete len:103 (+) comp18312_c0_seq1:1664-1972(+)